MIRQCSWRRILAFSLFISLLGACLVLPTGSARATDFDWDNFSGDSSFDTRTNWNPFPDPPNAPGAGDTAIFDGQLAGTGVGNNTVNVTDGTAIDMMQVFNSATFPSTVVDLTIGDGTTASRFDLDQTIGDSLVLGDHFGDTATLNLLGGRLDTWAATISGQAIFNVVNPGSLWDSTSVLISGDTNVNTAAVGVGLLARIVTHGDLDVGGDTGSGRVVVESTGVGTTPSQWIVTGSVGIGPPTAFTFDFGSVTLQTGGQMNVDQNMNIHGGEVASTLTVKTGANLNITGSLNIEENGVLELFDPASTITTGDIDNNGGTLDWTGGTLHITDSRLRIDDSTFADLDISTLTVDSGMALKVSHVTGGKDSLTIGNVGTGLMTVQNGGSVESYKGYVGEGSGSDGTVHVNAASWTVTEDLVIGGSLNGVGLLNIANGGQVSANSIVLGFKDTADGTITVDNGTLLSTAILAVGGSIDDLGAGAAPGGTGTLTIQNGGAVDVANTLIVFGGGTVNLTGGGSQITADTLRLEPGATFTEGSSGTLVRTNHLVGFGNSPSFLGNLHIGYSGGSGFGNHTVGAGQTLTVNQDLAIGTDAMGTLTISGGMVHSGDSFIGGVAGSDGSSVDIFGPNAFWFANQIHVGGNGIASQAQATLSIANNAQAVVSDRIKVWAPGALILEGGVVSTDHIEVEGEMLGNGVILLGSGPTAVTNRGLIAPGQSPGVLTINGNASTGDSYVQEASGLLFIEIGGTSPAQYDRIDVVSGSAALGGALNVSLIDASGGSNLFVPKAGDRFEIFTADGGLGGTTFTTPPASLGGLTGDLMWDIVYGSTFVRLDVTTPYTADFDGDGDVDADDLTQWQGDFGSNGDSDANNDGDSDGADFLAWQRQFGSGTPSLAASQSVPEPTSLLLATIACVAGGVCFSTGMKDRCTPRPSCLNKVTKKRR